MGEKRTDKQNQAFFVELRELINKHCMENDSDTPDYILANVAYAAIQDFNRNVAFRSNWYGNPERREDSPLLTHEEALAKELATANDKCPLCGSTDKKFFGHICAGIYCSHKWHRE